MMNNKSYWFVRYRIVVLAICVVVFALSCVPLYYLKTDSNLRSYFSDEMKALRDTRQIEKEFSSTEPIMLLAKADNVLHADVLNQLSEICFEIEEQDWVDKVMSVFNSKNIQSADGFMLVEDAIPYFPETDQDITNLTLLIESNSLVYGVMISKHFNYMLVLVQKNSDANDNMVYESLKTIVEKHKGPAEISIAGEPQLRAVINHDVRSDLYFLMPAGVLLMFLFLWFTFRKPAFTLLPISIIVFSMLAAFALLPVVGWKVSMISLLVPVMILAIANNYGVHFVEAFRQERASFPTQPVQNAIANIYKRLRWPVLLTGLTTIAGILGMLAHIMIPARQTGVVTAWGIAIALLLSLVLIPVLLQYFKTIPGSGYRKNPLTRRASLLLSKIAGNIIAKPVLWLVSVIIVMILAGSGVFRLKVDPNAENVLPRKHVFLQTAEIINNEFGGSKNISILIKGDIKDPEMLRCIDSLEYRLKQLPQTGNVVSIATVIKIMSKALYEPDEPAYNVIPETREAVAQLLELYSMGGSPEDFEQLVDFNYSQAIVNVQFRAADNNDYRTVVNEIDKSVSGMNLDAIYGGYALITYHMIDAIIKGQVYSLVFAIAVVFMLLWIIFKSWRTALVGCIPLIITIVVMFGLMGYAGFSVDIVSALISSVVIGIGIDYTIHFLWRYRLEVQQGYRNGEAVFRSLTTTGKGIIINAVSVILGFAVLLFSSFVALQSFAFLMITALSVCLVCSLVVVPAICLLKPNTVAP